MSGTDGKVLALGELLWDLLPSGKALGGAPANFAYRLCELGTPAVLISRVGNDELGKEALSILKERGLDISLIQSDSKKPTGTVNVELSEHGDAHYVIVPDVAYDYLEASPEILAAAKQAKAICYGTLVQRSQVTRNSVYKILDAASDALKVLDVNLRKLCFDANTLASSLKYADILKLNRDEVKVMGELLNLPHDSTRAFAEHLLEHHRPSLVLVTCGSNGVLAYSEEESELHIPGYSVSVMDTVGSGDNFTAGFLHKWLKGAPLEESCKFGNCVGALAASKKGGMPSIKLPEIESMPSVQSEHRTSPFTS